MLNATNGEPIAILNHNKPAAYLVPANVYEKMLDLIEYLELADLVRKRQKQKEQAIQVELDDL